MGRRYDANDAGSAGAPTRESVLTLLLSCLAGVLLMGLLAPDATTSVASTCTSSLQAKIDAAPSGATVDAEPCIYREQLVITKPITLRGQPGSEIRGSEVWVKWQEQDDLWRSEETVPAFPQTAEAECTPGTERCLWPEQVFLDGKPLRQVVKSPDTGEFVVDADRRIILKEDPRAHRVEVTVRRYWVLGNAENVTIQGFTMRHAANGGRSGAIMNRTGWLEAGYADWTVQDNVLSHAHGAVVSLTGATGLKILNNDISRGGQLGIKSTGQAEIIRGNKIHHNNTEGFNWKWEAGGMKTSHAENVIVDSNEFYHNRGNAIWFDVECSNNIIIDNRIYHNARHGIHYEISELGEISGNVLWENGWGTPDWVFGSAISSANSTSVHIHHNTLAWNADGISVVGLDRQGDQWDEVRDVRVHHNKILIEDAPEDSTGRFALAWLQGWSAQMFDPESNNRGQNNLYWYAGPEDKRPRYEWAKERYASLAEFDDTLGEQGGRYLEDAEKRRVVSEAKIPTDPEQRSSHTSLEKTSTDILSTLNRIVDGVVSTLHRVVSVVL